MKTIFRTVNYNFKKIKIDDYWKLHISCRRNDFYDILKIVNEVCRARNIFYKFPNSEKNLEFILRQKSEKWIYGKVFTIYFTEEEDAKVEETCKDLYKRLKDFKGPRIDSDIRYKNSIVHLRYGTYFANNFKDGSYDRVKMYFNVKENVQIPDFIKREIKEENIANVIEKYDIQKKICSDNFHTILKANKDGDEYILKAYKKFTELDYLVDIRDKESHLPLEIMSFFNKPKQIKITTRDMYIYITKYIASESIDFLISNAEQAYIKISEEDKKILIRNMVNIYLFLEKTGKYWIDFNLRNMIFFEKKVIAIDLKYLINKKDSDKVYFSTDDFLKFGDEVNKILLLNNILILKFGYYHFEHMEDSYFRKLMVLRILMMDTNSHEIRSDLLNIFKIKTSYNEMSALKLIELATKLRKQKISEIFNKIISNKILTKNLNQNRGVWSIKINGKFHTGLSFGGLGYLISMHLKTNDEIWLNRIQENSNYFSIRNNTIEHGFGGYILAEIYLLFNSPGRVNKKRLTQRIALLQVLDWKVYNLIKKLLK